MIDCQDGGFAGMFGRGTDPSLDGMGGIAGNGGNAFVKVSRDSYSRNGRYSFYDLVAVAEGGDGGSAYGIGAIAGNGGSALTQAINSSEWSEHQYPRIELKQYGGNGGIDYLGANGGSGASVSYGVGFKNLTYGTNVDGLRSRFTYLLGVGGNGGNSFNGIAGKGGNAAINMMGYLSMLGSHDNVTTRSFIELYGGAGGKGIAEGAYSVSGAHGGYAIMTGTTEFTGVNADTFFDIKLSGGNGGAAHGFQNTGNGGNGGGVVFDPFSINVAEGSTRRQSNVEVDLKGGDGGNAFGTGRGGKGASIDYDSNVSMTVGNEGSSLKVSAIGGNGGWGKTENGDGGDASVRVNKAISFRGPFGISSRNKAFVDVTGGNAGLGTAATNQADGGDAYGYAIQSAVFIANTEAHARGGVGHFGRNGSATAITQATSVGGPIDEPMNYSAQAIATARPVTQAYEIYRPISGTRSKASAVAWTQSGDLALAQASAIGGWGTVISGNASANAYAQNFGDRGAAMSTSYSFAYTDRDPNTYNRSRSTSNSTSGSQTLRNSSNATAISHGHFSSSHAKATATGYNGLTNAQVQNFTESWNHSASMSSQAISFDNTNASFSLDSSTYGGFRNSTMESNADYNAYNHALVIPDQAFADAMLANSGLTDVFVDDTRADILTIGSMGGRAGELSGEFATLQITNSFDLVLSVEDFYDDKNLMVGLFGTRSTGDGFTEMELDLRSGSTTIFDETFTNLQQAEDFFDNALYDLGPMNALGDDLALDLEFSLTLGDAADSFEFDFVYGNADPRSVPLGSNFGNFSSVPEPAGGLVIFLSMISMANHRRRRIGEA